MGITMQKKTVMVKFDGDLEEVSVDTFVNVVAGYSAYFKLQLKLSNLG